MMVALNWFICCCNELISSCSALSELAVCCWIRSDRNSSNAFAKAFALRTASAFVGPATLSMSTLSPSTVPGALPSNFEGLREGSPRRLAARCPTAAGLQECQIVCDTDGGVAPRSLGKVESGVCAVTPGHDHVVAESDHKAEGGQAQPDLTTATKGAQHESKTDEPSDENDRGTETLRSSWPAQRPLHPPL